MNFTSCPLTNLLPASGVNVRDVTEWPSSFCSGAAVVYGAFQACFLLEIWGENHSLLSLIGASVSCANHGFGLGSVPRYL